MSKPSYATYIKDRLAGFGGTSNSFVYQDLVDFPELARRVFGDPGRARRKTPACNGPIAVADPQRGRDRHRQSQNRLQKTPAAEGFLSAASPGLISLFFRNDHYPSTEAYLEAIAEAMRPEYEAIVEAGLILQLDCPDLAMGRHIQHADLSLEDFRKAARLHIEALNHAVARIRAGSHADASLLGQLRRPASLRRADRGDHRCRLPGAAERDLLRGGQSAPRA